MAVQETNYWKIGLFVTLGVITALVALFYLGASRLARVTVDRVTYFDESVQGLDVGAPLKMRGVTIGTIRDITIAPDRRLVQVTCDVYVDVMVRLNLGTESQLKAYTAPIPDDLRVQLATTGITGVKFLLVDFFSDAHPPPELSFDPHRGYVPSTPSTLKSLEDSFFGMANTLPGTLDAITDLARTLERKTAAIDVAGVQDETIALVRNVDVLVKRLDASLAKVDVEALNGQLSESFEAMREVIWKADGLLEQLASAEGPLQRIAQEVEGADLPGTTSSVRDAVDSYGGLAGDGALLMAELQDTLVLLRESLAAVQSLAGAIEREPGSFISGRAPDPPRPKPNDR